MKKDSKSNFGGMGWMLIIYMMLSFFVTSLLSSSMNISAAIFSEMNGWNQAYLFSLNSIGGWISVIAIYFAGLAMSTGKMKLRPVIAVSAIVIGVSTLFWGYVKSIALFSALFIIYMIAYVLWAQLANQAICNNWFPRKAGLAIAWACFGLPIGAGPGVAVFGALLGKAGLAGAYVIIGIVTMILGVAGSLLFTEFPEQRGRFPDNDKSMTHEQAVAEMKAGQEMAARSSWTSKRLLKTKEVWMIALSCGYMLMFANGSILQVVPRLTAIGYSTEMATSMLTITALCALPGGYLCGLLDNKLGPRIALIITSLIASAACVLYTIPNGATIWVALIMIGIALGGSSHYIMSATTKYFGRYSFGKVFGTLQTINTLVGQSGAAMIAVLAARWNYSVAYFALAVLGIVAVVIIFPVKDGFAQRCEEKFAMEDAIK